MPFNDDPDAVYTGRSKIVQSKRVERPSEVIRKRKEKERNRNESDTVMRKKALDIKRRSAKIRSFVNTIAEVSGLIDVAFSYSDKNGDSIKSATAYLKLQEKVKKTIFDKLLIDEFDKEIKRSGYFLGREISKMIYNGELRGHDEKKLGLLADIITEVNSTSAVMRDLYEDVNISSDTLVNIKCSIFPFAIKIEQILHDIGMKQHDKLIQIQWFHSMSLSLAKDVAFNWDKHSGFREREIIFENMLKHCCEIVYTTWVEMIVEQFRSDFILLNPESVIDNIPKLIGKIESQSMGYLDHPIYNLEWLKSEISKYLHQIVSSKKVKLLSNKNNGIYFGCIIKMIDQKSVEIWDDESKIFFDKFNSLSSSEQREWLKSEDGQKPMSIEGVKKKLYYYIFSELPKELDLKLENEELERSAARRFALLWGMSNAICKTKSN